MNTTINLGIDQSNTISYILQLSHNEKWELFLRPLWGNKKPSNYMNGLDMSEREIRNMDHFSFHEDGTIHLRIKDASGNRDKILSKKWPGSIKTITETEFATLLVLSIYDFAWVKELVSRPKSLKFKGSRNVSVLIDHPNRNRFSIVLFLLGAQLDPKSVLQTHFPAVFNLGQAMCIQDYLVDIGDQHRPHVLQLLVAITDKVLRGPSVDDVEQYKKLKQLPRVDVPVGISVAPLDDHIRSMV